MYTFISILLIFISVEAIFFGTHDPYWLKILIIKQWPSVYMHFVLKFDFLIFYQKIMTFFWLLVYLYFYFYHICIFSLKYSFIYQIMLLSDVKHSD